jgi:hypothetical protein
MAQGSNRSDAKKREFKQDKQDGQDAKQSPSAFILSILHIPF